MKIIKTAKLNKKAAWGRAGAGILFVCKEDETAMLLLRSEQVEDPGVWGVPGGAVKGTEGFYDDSNEDTEETLQYPREQLWHTAMEETQEEIGYFPKQFTVHAEHVTYDTNPSNPNSFKYYTFIVDVPFAEKEMMFKSQQLNWENDEMQWLPIQQIMQDIRRHKGRGHAEFSNGSLHKGVGHAMKSHPMFNSPDKTGLQSHEQAS